MRSRIWTIANAFWLLTFTFAAIVQYNDADALRWVAVYAAAALASALAMMQRDRWWLPALLALVALAWAATLAPRVIGRVPFTHMFGAFEMADTGVEQARELYGLLLIAVWMTVLAVAGWRRQRSERSVPSIML